MPTADKTVSYTHHGVFKPEEVAVAVVLVPPDDTQVTLAEVLVRQVDHVPDLPRQNGNETTLWGPALTPDTCPL